MAGVYYCTPSGAGAHDGASIGSAWSLGEAVAHAVAGDVVLLQSGTYSHFHYTRSNADWITWRADEGQTVTFADGATLGGYASTALFRCRFEGIIFHTNTVSTASGKPRYCGVWATGGTATSTNGPGYLQFVDCEFILDIVTGTGLSVTNLHHVDVHNCTAHSSLDSSVDWQAMGIRILQSTAAADVVTDINISGCELSKLRYGMSVTGVNVTVQGNHIHDCTSDGMLIENGFQNSRVIDNHIHDIYNEPSGPNSGDHCDGIQLQQKRNALHPDSSSQIPWDNILIARNVIHDSRHQCVHWGGLTPYPPTNITVENNLFYGGSAWDFEIRSMTGGSIRFIHNTVLGRLRFQQCNDYEFRNNLVYNANVWIDEVHGGNRGVAKDNICVESDLPIGGENGNKKVSPGQWAAMFFDFRNQDFSLAPGAMAIDFAPILSPSDGLGNNRVDIPDVGNEGVNYADAGAFEYTGAPGNHPPVLTPIGDLQVETGTTLTFAVSATDADGDPITFGADDLPTGATFVDRTFTWTPEEIGSYRVTFTATDGQAQSSEIVTITTDRPNKAPVLSSVGDHSVRENELLTFSIAATDRDQDPIDYSMSNAPSVASLAGQVFRWTPTFDQAGRYDVTFIADDGRVQTAETVTISVANVNRPPGLTEIGDRSVDENNALSLTVSGADPDDDELTYSATGLPAGARFTDQTFTWTPAPNQTGSYEITFAVTDGDLFASETITVMVVAVAPDEAPPTVARQSPIPDAIQVPLNNLVSLHVSDVGTGLDAKSLVITMDGDIVYRDNVDTYQSPFGQCTRSGTKNDLRFIYQPTNLFDYDHTVAVMVSAADLAGNALEDYTYGFTTEMRAFGGNREVSGNTETPGKSRPATVCDNTGNLWVAWHAGPEDARNIYVAKRPAGADGFESPMRLTHDSRDQCNPDIAAGANGSVYVVWQDNQYGHWDVFLSVCPDGRNFSRSERVTDRTGNEINPAIATGGPSVNQVYVTWQDDRNGNQDIYVAGSDSAFAAGTVWRVTSDPADQREPDIAVDAQGAAYVVWTDERTGHADIYGAVSGDGSWANVPVVTEAADQTDCAIAVEPDSSVLHLLWVDNAAGNEDIHHATSEGLPVVPVTGLSIVDDTSASRQLLPSIVCGINQVFACWQDERNIGMYETDTDLYFAELSPGTMRTNVLVGNDDSNTGQRDPTVGVDGHGQPYVVWVDDRHKATEIRYAGATFIDPSPLDSKVIVASAGATIGTEPSAIDQPDDVSIVVPAGACRTDVRLTISRIVNPQVSPIDCLGSYEFGPSGIDFDQPVLVTIPYQHGGNGGRARAFWYDSLTGLLSQQGITNVETIVISPDLHALQFRTTHFTPFYLVAEESDDDSSGGCSVAATRGGSAMELLVPCALIAIAVAVLRWRDRKLRASR